MKQINILLITILLLAAAIFLVPGYHRLAVRLVYEPVEAMIVLSDISDERKHELRLGFDYQLVEMIRQQTPDDAIIIFPPDSVFLGDQLNSKGAWGAKSRVWSTYFLYPRILIAEEDQEKFPELYAQATHVMVVNSWGYHKTPEFKGQKRLFGVLPLSKGDRQ